MNTSASLAPLLEHFFTQRLMQQRQASPHTISSYRDTFRQFLKFAQGRWTIWRSITASAFVAAICGSRQFTPSSDMPRSSRQRNRHRSSVC
jgi:site-specific recombinase XerD